MTLVELILAVAIANVLGAALYEPFRWLALSSWRRRNDRIRRAGNLARFRAHLAGNRDRCNACGRALMEHEAIQNDVGCYAECPHKRVARYITGPN